MNNNANPIAIQGLLSIVGIFILGWYFDKKNERAIQQYKDQVSQKEQERLSQIEALSRAQLDSVMPDGITVRDNEIFYWKSFAKIIGDQHHVHYAGGSGGISIPLGHGFSVYTGRSRVQRIDSISQAIVDAGDLFISNQRLVFIGEKKSQEIFINSILKATPFNNGFRIDRANKSPFVAMTQLPFDAVILHRVMAGNADRYVENPIKYFSSAGEKELPFEGFSYDKSFDKSL